jgi:hypothetical protein
MLLRVLLQISYNRSLCFAWYEIFFYSPSEISFVYMRIIFNFATLF